MNRKKERTTFGFIGFGLIGGSVARALRCIYPDSTIIAYNYYQTKKHPQLELAREEHTLSKISTSLSDFSACDVIFLCAPVITNVSYLKELVPYINEDCIITDVGSVKGNIHAAAQKLNIEKQFIGGHPMTGSEKTGYTHSNADFLKGAYYLLTPTKKTDPEYTDWMQGFVKAAGCLCLTLDYITHDRITAGISHGPHIVSAALVNTVAKRDTDGNYGILAAGGFRDITRISSSSPEMWQNICLTNQEPILEFLDEYIALMEQMKKQIQDKDADALMTFFSEAKKYRDGIL